MRKRRDTRNTHTQRKNQVKTSGTSASKEEKPQEKPNLP